MDTVTLIIEFPDVEGEPHIDEVKMTLVGRTEAELAEYSLLLVRALRRGDWIARVVRTVDT